MRTIASASTVSRIEPSALPGLDDLLPEVERLVALRVHVGQLVDPRQVCPVVVEDRQLRAVLGCTPRAPRRPSPRSAPRRSRPRRARPAAPGSARRRTAGSPARAGAPSTGSASTGCRPAGRSPRRCPASTCRCSPAGRTGPWRSSMISSRRADIRRSSARSSRPAPRRARRRRRPRWLAVDPGVHDALARRDQPVGAAGEVADPLERAGADRVGIERDEVGVEARLDAAPSVDPEHVGRVTGQPPDRLLQREHAEVAAPVAEQPGRVVRVAELAGVRAGVGQPEQQVRVLQQLGDLLVVVVHHRDAELRLEALGRAPGRP